MRPYWVLLPLFGAVVSGADDDAGTAGRRLVWRQDESSSESVPSEDPTESTTTEEPTETSTVEEEDPTTTTTEPPEEDDVTVTVTTTVEGDGETVSSRVTSTVTSTTVIIDVTTERETITVTSRDQETATETVYTTTTVFGSRRKRDTWLLDVVPAEPAAVPAVPTGLDADSYEAYNAEMIKRVAAPQPGPNIFKRATITETETVTEGGGDTTVVATVTQTVVTASTSESTEVETITETEQADARTTVTTTRTFTTTVNTISTDIFTAPITESEGPVETNPADNDDDGGDSGGGGGGGGGLSTGAKAGIGAGAGVAGLLLLGGLAWFCLKKRHSGPKHESDDLFGASEVPVGAGAGAGSGSGRGAMSHQPSTSTSYAPTRSPILPNVAPEGYRGTAMGDGRAGYAKPEPYGAAYARPSAQHPPPTSVSPVSPPATGYSHPTNRTSTFNSGPDHLPEHHTPADMNGVGAGGYGAQRSLSTSPGPYAAELGHEGHSARWQSPGAAEVDTTPAGYHQRQQAPSNVYEMPAPQDQR